MYLGLYSHNTRVIWLVPGGQISILPKLCLTSRNIAQKNFLAGWDHHFCHFWVGFDLSTRFDFKLP